MSSLLPADIDSEDRLEDALSEPTDMAVGSLDRLPGDVMLLGAGGKMGLSLARMVRRAADQSGTPRRVLAVSRFSQPGQAERFARYGVETLAGDLLDESFLGQLPPVPHVIFMTGMKFGSGSRAAETWAMNVHLPALVARHFRASRYLVFSTGNVYPFVPVDSGGSVETDRPEPVGEYGMSALGRERIFEYFSHRDGLPVSIVRLNYAVELRYGVLVDLALQVYQHQPIDLSMGFANVIWQRDANAHALCALADAESPPLVVNVAGVERLDVRAVCEQFAARFGRHVTFVGEPAANALLSNGSKANGRYGADCVTLAQMIDGIAAWIERGGTVWQKPTHFQTRDGRF